MNEWVSVKDCVPDSKKQVLISFFNDKKELIYTQGIFSGVHLVYLDHHGCLRHPTHWMELPPLPRHILPDLGSKWIHNNDDGEYTVKSISINSLNIKRPTSITLKDKYGDLWIESPEWINKNLTEI